LYGTQQSLIKLDQYQHNILEFLCEQSNKLRNCASYWIRQYFFNTNIVNDNPFDLHEQLKDNPHYKIFYSQAAQQICTEVAESFKSYKQLLPLWFRGELAEKPRLPKYRKKDGVAGITYPKQALSFDIETSLIRLPLGQSFKSNFEIDSLYIQLPYNLKFSHLKELRILPRNRCFYAEFIYEKPLVIKPDLDSSRALAIDPGVNNWLTCVPNTGENSFIIDGRKLKSLNQWYNKLVATLKEGKVQGFWNEKLAQITEKRNRQVRDAVNKAARTVINICLKSRIGTLVFGWNKGNKDGIETGKINNQKIVQMPTARLKQRIAELCEQYGIQFVETEESYTSKSSFLDGDILPSYGEKPNGWKASGKRTERGTYVTSKGEIINSDCNGAANIFRKVETQLGINLAKVCRGILTIPTRIFIWNTKSKKRRGAALAHLEVTT
jgi:putative transposase